MRHVAMVLVLLGAVAAAAWAVDPPREAPAEAAPSEDVYAFPGETPPAPRPPPAPPASAPAAPAGDDASAPAAEQDDVEEELPPLPPQSRNVGPTAQRFDPTEKVRADFPVSFPVDI